MVLGHLRVVLGSLRVVPGSSELPGTLIAVPGLPAGNYNHTESKLFPDYANSEVLVVGVSRKPCSHPQIQLLEPPEVTPAHQNAIGYIRKCANVLRLSLGSFPLLKSQLISDLASISY